ncbi:MAG: hypothetical protein IPP51_06870 [Bacteroidetes bacterium]|nr:hypothetical protein [Bacteroidota bacterium]
MKSRVILTVFVLLLATPLWMRIGWEFSPRRQLNLLIVDKTVLNTNSFKHRSINWILDYEKYIKSDGSYYDINKDYFGFFPQEDEHYLIQDFEKLNEPEVDSLSKHYDMAYFADTYGVLGNEWYSHRDRNDNSESIYGGLSEKDLLLMKKMKARQKPVIAEFNTIGYPTPVDMRVEFEKLWGIHWTGWMTRYIASLDTVNNPDLPRWIVRAYKKEHAGKWNFKNDGMLFIHESGKVLVMEKGNELNDGIPKIYTEKKFQNQYGVPAVMIYPYWIDIMENKNDTNELISKYVIGTNPNGEQLLSENGIPKIFPAIIHHEKDYNFYYFCGDFADNPTKFRFAKLYGVTGLKFLMYNAVDVTDRNRFFWEFYLPMMQTIFSNTYVNRLQRR